MPPWPAIVEVHGRRPKGIEGGQDFNGLTWTEPNDELHINIWVQPKLAKGPQGESQERKVERVRELLGVVVHECVHAKQFLERAVETRLDAETEAYLVQMLVTNVLALL